MNRAELERMTLEELYRTAAEGGVREAAGLPREALIERLTGGAPPPRAKPTTPAQPAAPAAPAAVPRAAAATQSQSQGKSPDGVTSPAPAAGEAAPPDGDPTRRPGAADRSRRAAARGAMIPSGVAPDRPTEHDPEDMARLYLDQGEPQRAAHIYRELLLVRPDDESLVVGLAAAEARLRELTRFSPGEPEVERMHAARSGEPMGMLDLEEPPESYGVDECELIAKDPHHLFVYWEVTERALASARADLGEEAATAHLVLRLIATAGPGEHHVPERDIRDHQVEWNQGRRYFPSPRPGARERAAIGLLCPSGLFVPVAHSSQSRVPPGEPSGQLGTEWMEVDPERTRGREREAISIRNRAADHSERGVATPRTAKEQKDAAGEHKPSSPSSPWRWRPGSQS